MREPHKSILHSAVSLGVFAGYESKVLVRTIQCTCCDGDLSSGAGMEGKATAGNPVFLSGFPPENQITRHPAEDMRAHSGLPGAENKRGKHRLAAG